MISYFEQFDLVILKELLKTLVEFKPDKLGATRGTPFFVFTWKREFYHYFMFIIWLDILAKS